MSFFLQSRFFWNRFLVWEVSQLFIDINMHTKKGLDKVNIHKKKLGEKAILLLIKGIGLVQQAHKKELKN